MNRRAFLQYASMSAVAAFLPTGCKQTQRTAPAVSQSKAQPNIVFILADDLGWNDIGYHNPEIRSPHLDRLAGEGIELNRHYVQPQCTPTRVALMTGRYPSRFGNHCTQASNLHSYPFETLTMASMLKSMGYTTGCFGKWHMGSLPKWGPNHHGFDYSYGSLAGAVGMYDHRYRLNRPEYITTWHRNLRFITEKGHATDLVTDEAIRWIEANQHRPFFCYVPYQTVHTPLVEESKWLDINKHIDDPDRRLMAAAISHLDASVGRIVEALNENGLRENTIIVFASDNGGIETSYSGGRYPPPDPPLAEGFSSNLPLRGGKRSVYEGGIRVPAWINWQGTLGPSADQTVSHIVDWMPTFATLTGFTQQLSPERIAQYQWDGHNIWPYITDQKKPSQDRQIYWVWGKNRDNVAIRKGDWKLLRNGRESSWELYNVAQDPFEQNNLYEQKPEKVRYLRDLFNEEKQKDRI